MDAFHLDLRYALRSLQTSPSFTFLAVVMLALGIGATTLVYGVLDAVVLRPLPCPAPDRMVLVVESHPQRGKMLVRPANYEDWRRRAPWLEQSGMAFGTSFVLTGEGRHIAGALTASSKPGACCRNWVVDFSRTIIGDRLLRISSDGAVMWPF